MYVLTNSNELVHIETGNCIKVEGKRLILITAADNFILGEYEKPEDELKNLASKLTTYVMPQGVEK